MTPEQRLERAAAIAEELSILNRVPAEGAALLDRELERLSSFHTEKCCDPRLTPEQSAMHREARAQVKNLVGFFLKRRAALKEELLALRR